MAKAIVDPDELRNFALALKNFNSELAGQLTTIHRQFTKLGDTWRDQEQQKFAEEFDSTLRMLGSFVEASERQVPLLLRKAQRIDEYLGQH